MFRLNLQKTLAQLVYQNNSWIGNRISITKSTVDEFGSFITLKKHFASATSSLGKQAVTAFFNNNFDGNGDINRHSRGFPDDSEFGTELKELK